MGLTLERLQELLSYDPETGLFTWRVRLSIRVKKIGAVAGVKMKIGYVAIGIDGRDYYAHRLAWFISHGRWPNAQIDHINGIRTDNRLVNLREAQNCDNALNKKRRRQDNTSGITGVCFDATRKRWFVRVRDKFIGRFTTLEAAIEARQEAAKEVFGKSEFWTGI